jgi:hypothetical protein
VIEEKPDSPSGYNPPGVVKSLRPVLNKNQSENATAVKNDTSCGTKQELHKYPHVDRHRFIAAHTHLE